jgi:hypothetical protein
MARPIVNVLISSAVALGCVVIVGATIAWSNIAGPIGGQAYLTTAEFDQAFADAAAPALAQNTEDKLRAAGLKRAKADTLLRSFWVAAIASPYLGAKNADLLSPLNHMPMLPTTGKFIPAQSALDYL